MHTKSATNLKYKGLLRTLVATLEVVLNAFALFSIRMATIEPIEPNIKDLGRKMKDGWYKKKNIGNSM